MFAIMVEDMIHMETYSVEHVSNHAQQINIQLLIPIHDYANQDALSQPNTLTLLLINVLHLVLQVLNYSLILSPKHVSQIAHYILKGMDI